MLCPKCFTDQHGVVNSRGSTEFIYRRRKCFMCNYTWVTVEVDLDLIDESYRDGDGYENNSKALNELLHLKKPKGGKP